MSAVSLRPIPCRQPMTMIESVCQGALGGICLGLAYRPRFLLSATFFTAFGVYNYLLIRCNLLCMTSGESFLRPKYASPAAAFFASSATAFMYRPGLSLGQVIAVTAVSSALGSILGAEEEVAVEAENTQVSHHPFF